MTPPERSRASQLAALGRVAAGLLAGCLVWLVPLGPVEGVMPARAVLVGVVCAACATWAASGLFALAAGVGHALPLVATWDSMADRGAVLARVVVIVAGFVAAIGGRQLARAITRRTRAS